MHRVPQISPKDANEKIKENDNFLILDVRENHEVSFSHLKQTEFTHIKMREIQSRYHELPKDKEIGVLCRSGARSAQVALFLNNNGYNAMNIAGGINNWSDTVDPSIPKYALRSSQIIPL